MNLSDLILRSFTDQLDLSHFCVRHDNFNVLKGKKSQ